jgi:NAD(P)-dependent dehydrogenase (short-subunit alcohol dehydrogenase family)
MGSLDDRTVIISGVGAGLGRETALVVAREGGNVVLGARTEASLEAVAADVEAAGGAVAWRRTDITSDADCRALVALAVERFGGVDALVNCAALDTLFGGLEAAGDFALWRETFEVNLYGSFTMTRAALGAMRQRGGGSVVFVSAQSQHHPPQHVPQMAYASSKAAITGALRHLANEVGPDGIRVNEVAPGWMWGPPVEGYVTSSAAARGVDPSVVLGELTAHMPLRRMATDGEVAEALVFFASPRSSGITGQTLLVNAGEVVH